MRPLFETVTDFVAGAEVLRDRPYGMIRAAGGRLAAVHLRPLPKMVSLPEVVLLGPWQRGRMPCDCCLIYYDQPRRHRGFLALKYVITGRATSLATVRAALTALDE